MRRRCFLAGALAIFAATPLTALAQPGEPDLTMLEPIAGVAATPDGLVIQVLTGGCGGKADFASYVERSPGRTTIAFARKVVRPCPGARPVPLSFSYAELGVARGTPVEVLNPVRAAATPMRPLRPVRRPSGKRSR